jgi:RNase H-like domain found in reverse transcriptase
MTGYYRRCIKNYSVVAAPLNKYLKGDREKIFNLDAEALQAHKALKKAISTAPVLALPNKTGRYVIEADASEAQLGAELLQEQADK